MTLPEVIEGMQEKLELVAAHLRHEKEENQQLRNEIEDLQHKLAEKESEIARARLDAEYLTYSYRLAESPDSILQTRRRLSALIRDIDRCISMLKDDPEI